jgi:hypothetical protein
VRLREDGAQALQVRSNGGKASEVELSLAQRAGLACCTAERGKAEAMQALVGWSAEMRDGETGGEVVLVAVAVEFSLRPRLTS